MTSKDSLIQENERLKAQALELARVNENLERALAERKRSIDELERSVHGLRSLAAISADWYWEQDADHRFVKFSGEQAAAELDIERDSNAGKRRWELPGAVPLTGTWDDHRAVLDAHQPFRNFEYTRVLGDGLQHYLSVSGVPMFDLENRFLGYRGTVQDISEIKRSEEAERKAARFLDDIVDNIPIAFHLKSVRDEHRVILWNKAAEDLYGVLREDTLGHTLHEIWPKEDADRMYQADRELVAGGETQDYPDRMVVTRHRGPIRVHMRKVPLKDANGKVSHILITAEDITERLADNAILRYNQERFRSLTELSSDWYWETDDQFRFTVLSGGETKEDRSTIDNHLGKARWEIDSGPRDKAAWGAHKALLERHETFRNFEYQRDAADGRRLTLCISGEPFFDANGQFLGYRGVGTDITARKETEAALRVSETRFRAVVAALAEGVVLRDAEGRIVDCNASAERILGKTLAEMEGQTFAGPDWEMLREDGTLMPEEEHPNTVAKRTGLPQSNVVVCYRKADGNVLWALINVRPLFGEGSRTPTGFVTTVTDISKRKHAEMEIVRLNVDLENRVLRRTAQLEAVNKELEAFSYSVAHDLRSPLSAIDGYCALLQKAVTPEVGERAHHYLVRIRSGVRRMGELTDGLLSLAQLSRTSLSWETVDMSAEAVKIIGQCAENDTTRQVQTTVEPGMLVRADGALLRQVLENLIANAWKFSSKKPHASITVGRQIGADQQAVYFVRDTGAGFDMAYVDKLFGTFQRLHSPEEFAGSGIGLATVKRIVTRHGGRIWAESVLGEGSTFYFTLGSDQGASAAVEARAENDAGVALAQVPRSMQLFKGVADASSGSAISSDNDAYAVGDQQFSNAFEHAAIGMALIAVDSRRLRVNSAFCKMLGYSEAEMLSRTVHEITHPDDVEWDVLQRKRALAGEIETYQWEKRYIHQSGRIVWGYLSCSLVRDADRKPLHFISQIQDITERKEAERVLRESEERFRALTALSSDWFWEQDENFRFVQISGDMTSTHLAASSRESAIGKTRWELDHVNMDESVWEAHKAQLERHEIFRDFEVTRLDANGEIRYVSISGVPIFDTNGRFTGYRGTGRDNTEMRRVSDALRASELQLRQITDTVPALISYVDRDTRFHFHNRAYEEAFGLTREQIEGKTMLEVMGEEFYDRVRTRVEEVLTGYPVVYERTQITPRGAVREYAVNYFPRYGDDDEDGEVIGFYSLATDITERKAAERVLRESEERFRALTALSSDWFWEQDENFRFVQVAGEANDNEMAGLSREMIVGKTRWELDFVNMNEGAWDAHREQLERHEVFHDFEITRLDADGQIRYVAVSGVPIFDETGRFTGYRGTGRDNTEMHRAVEALRTSELQLRQITDTVPALIAYVDRDLRFHFHNRAYEEAFGLTSEQIEGKTMLEVMGEEFFERVRPRVEEVLTGYPVVYERTQKTARGDNRDYVVNYFPRYGDDEEEDEVIGFYALATDITELKRIDRMKSEFVSTVSHELRTPLTSIRGSLGLISGGVAGQLPDAVKTLVGIAKNNCERLIRLINDILDIEKIESGKMRLELQVVQLRGLLTQALASTEGFGAAQNVGLSLHFPDDEIQVNVDSDRLTQVVTNLLSNAMKFSPQGDAVEVHVLRSGSSVRVEVRDHGPGIPEEFRKRIFQKFSQADSSDTRQKGGTGLGLNISRAIIERLNGSIGFETEAGVGTTFFFELPEWKELAPSEPSVGGSSGRPRILICEDDRDIARLIGMMLDKGGFDSDMVFSAGQALKNLAETTYAAMTVDLKLPDQDGITLIRTLRSQESTRDLPIVVVSAMAGEGHIAFNNQPLSVSDWLDKPIDENLLVLGLRRAIDGMEGKPRILHVEDDLDIQRITAAIAQDFATFVFAASLQEARARLLEQRYDLILLDLTLPEGSGWGLLTDIEALDRPPPVVVFSAMEVDRIQSLRATAVLLKAQTSNAELLETLQRVLKQSQAPAAEPS